MNSKQKKYILDNIDKQSIKDIAKHIGVAERKIARFLKAQRNVPVRADSGKLREEGYPRPATKLKWYYSVLIYALILLISFAVLTPIIIPKAWPRTHEDLRYIFVVDEFKDAVMNGVLYPRWLPDAFGGYGYPTFVYYQPSFFFIAMLFAFLPGYPLYTMYATLIFLFFIGGAGVYKLCRELSGPLLGLFCSILFLLTPYLYVDLYVRGGISELTAMLLCPWPIYFLILLKKRIENNSFQAGAMFGVAISLFAVIISHPATALFFCIVFGLTSIYISIFMGSFKKQFIQKVLLSAALGVILSSPYWFTVFQMKKYINMSLVTGGLFQAKFHVVYPHQFFSRFWGFGYSVLKSAKDGMPFQLGLPHFLLAVVGMIWGRKDKIIQVSFALYILLIFLMTNYSIPLWNKVTLIQYAQFPWRILSVTASLQIICISGMKNILAKHKHQWIKVTLLLFILIITTAWHSNQFRINNYPYNASEALKRHRQTKLMLFHSYTIENELMPKTISIKDIKGPRGNSPLVLVEPPAEIEELKGNTNYRIRYEVKNKVPSAVIINQFYMPGWRVIVDGKDISPLELEGSLTPDGRIKFSLPSGKDHQIEAFYGGPPGWFARNIIIFIASIAFLAFCFYSEKKRLSKMSNSKGQYNV